LTADLKALIAISTDMGLSNIAEYKEKLGRIERNSAQQNNPNTYEVDVTEKPRLETQKEGTLHHLHKAVHNTAIDWNDDINELLPD
jgi:hypothetical protein